jgi:hypothetical protein
LFVCQASHNSRVHCIYVLLFVRKCVIYCYHQVSTQLWLNIYHIIFHRAPFGLFYHAAWFTQPHHKEGFIAFLDTIVNMQDVWLVTNWQAIQWVRDPTPLSRISSFPPFQCNYPVSMIIIGYTMYYLGTIYYLLSLLDARILLT